MKKAFSSIILILLLLPFYSRSVGTNNVLTDGSQPQIATDNKGVIRLVFGRSDEIFCATSVDNGITFSKPQLVAHVPKMHLGMSRGPQLASSAAYSIITAIDKDGDIHWFRLKHGASTWENMGVINDLKGSAPEGLMNIAADNNNNFYAVWLDTRTGTHNQIYFSSLPANTSRWSKNLMAYQSPDGHVCECCQPHIAVRGAEIAIMFRNWIKGSRDLYVIKSANSGVSFASAQKLGNDTWKLDGCPMDGGSIGINGQNQIATTWQRKGLIYFCEPGKPEVFIGNGRNSSLATNGANLAVTFQNNDTLKTVTLKNKKETTIGNGGFLKSTLLKNNQTLYVWELDNKIMFKLI